MRFRFSNIPALALHIALAIIVAGACVTHFFGEEGTLTLTQDNGFVSAFATDRGVKKLPFLVRLDSCETRYYPATTAPSDYISYITIKSETGNAKSLVVRMNHIAEFDGYRLCQNSMGYMTSTFTVTHDPWGIFITYCGYGLLFVSMIAFFLVRRGNRFYALLRSPMLRKGAVVLGTLGFASACIATARQRAQSWLINVVVKVVAIVSVVAVGCLIGLRTYISGHSPLANSTEAMTLMGWLGALCGLLLMRRWPLMLPMGLVVAGFAWLVASVGRGSAVIGQMAPVLASPLLSIHVFAIMLAYALLALIMLNSVAALCIGQQSEMQRLALISRILLYPAVFLLTFGIFIGAIWANQSWGRYWGWDPKETWALITLIVYALPLHYQFSQKDKAQGVTHKTQVPNSKSPILNSKTLHIYLLLAFLTVLMTYFGVNFFLPGLHSYA